MAKAAKVQRRAMALGDTAIGIVADDQPFVLLGKHFKMTVNGLEVFGSGSPSIEEADEVGTALLVGEKGAPFSIGDFVRYVEERFGEAAAQIIDVGLWSRKTVDVYVWLSERIAKEDRRMDRLGVKHHLLVAALSPEKQREWLAKAAADDEDKPWTAARLAAALKEGEDLPPIGLWVLVNCTDTADQLALQTQLEGMGRTCKAVERRGRK